MTLNGPGKLLKISAIKMRRIILDGSFMKKSRIKYLLDFVPLLVVIVYAVDSYWTMIASNTTLQWQHYLGIVFLILTILLIFINHQLGVICFGLTLFLSLITLLSFDFGLVTNWLSVTSFKIPIFWGNALSLVWLILHFVLSGRYYVGIVTKNYWDLLLKKNNKSIAKADGIV